MANTSKRVGMTLLNFLALIAIATATACLNNCTCTDAIIRCVRPDFPRKIPTDAHSMYIQQFDLTTVTKHSFEDSSWRNLTFLDIDAVAGKKLQQRPFIRLPNLEYLGLHGRELRSLESSTFEGLSHVVYLNFSYNRDVDLSDFYSAINSSGRKILPLLSNLDINELHTTQPGAMDFDYKTISTISFGRKLEYIDISGISISKVDLNSFEELLCNSLKHLRARRLNLFNYPLNAGYMNNCISLRILDLSDSTIPFALENLMKAQFTAIAKFIGIEDIYLNAILPKSYSFDNVKPYAAAIDLIPIFTHDFSHCRFHWRKIELQRNNLRRLEANVTIHESMQQSLNDVDISDNIVTYIAPSLLYPSRNLKVIRASKNRLSEMQRNDMDTFEQILSHSKQLREFYLAENGIELIPKLFFQSNRKLEHIDLSKNKLTSCDFDLHHLNKLNYLDLSYNRIHVLGEAARLKLDGIGTFNNTYLTDNVTLLNDSYIRFKINVGYNPFTCSCMEDSNQMREWLRTSEHVFRSNNSYTCTLEDITFDILVSESSVISLCVRKELMRMLSITLPVTIGSIITICVIVFVIHRRRKRMKDYQAFLQDLRNNVFAKKFLVFLSHCSEDADFVKDNLCVRLQEGLTEITGNDRNFVCLGDRDFHLGKMVHDEVIRCTEESSVVMFVVSNAFCKKAWCRMEVGEAYQQRKPIIMFMKEHVDPADMSTLLRQIFNRYTHAAWVDDDAGGHCEPNLRTMCESIIEMARKSERGAVFM